MGALLKSNAHVVDVLGNVIGRDQPIMRMEKAVELVSTLDESVFQDENVVFFDPFCKAGELLLSCAYLSCVAKMRKKTKLLDVSEIYNEIFKSNKYFALAPDERHHRLSLRTFLGNTNSHDELLSRVIRDGKYLSEIDGKLNKKKFIEEFEAMIEYIRETSGNKKIIAVGNPPYQENDGGFGGSASSVYNYFVETLMESKQISEFVVVIQSRWFTTGKGTSKFRDKVLASRSIKKIRHFKYSKSVFPTVDILGGVCFFHYDSDYEGKVNFTDGDVEANINLSDCDIILDDPKGYELVDKINVKWEGSFVSEVAWPVRPFAIRTNYFVKNDELPDGNKDAIPCFTKRRKIKNANINDIPKNLDKINEWKVAVPSAYAPGSKTGVRRVTLPINQYFIIPKGYITTETYNVVHSFKSKKEAENFLGYLKTDFARYFLGLRKVTQHVYRGQWSWVPLLSMKEEWNDKKLYKLFKITKIEQEHISKKLKEWS